MSNPDVSTPDTPTTDIAREIELHRERSGAYLAAAGPNALTSNELYARAEVLARSKLVPKALENNPDGIFLVGMMGAELGVSLVNSLSEIHVIEGRPSPSAQLRLSLIRRNGHDARFVESTDEKAVVRGRRREDRNDPDGWVTVEWTIEMARRAGLVDRWVERKFKLQGDRYDRTEKFTVGDDRGIYTEEDRRKLGLPVALPEWVTNELEAGRVKFKDNWQKYPADMLRARAASALFRMHFGDVILATGVDELTPEERGIDVTLDVDETRPEPEVYVDPDDEPVDAELVDEDPAPPPRADDGPKLSGQATISVRLKEVGITDRDTKLRLCAAVVDREIESTNDLTPVEIGMVLRTIEHFGTREALLEVIAEAEAFDQVDIIVPEHEEPIATVSTGTPELAPDEAPFEEPAAEDPVTQVPEQLETERLTGSRPADPGTPLTDTPAGPPSTWSDTAWRAFLAERGVKVTETIREAQRLAAEDGDRAPGTLGDLSMCSSSLLELLVGFVEETAAARGNA